MNARLESDLEAFKNTIKELRGELQMQAFRRKKLYKKLKILTALRLHYLKSLGIARENLENLKSKEEEKFSGQ